MIAVSCLEYNKDCPWRLKNKQAQPTAAPEISPPSENIWVLLRKTQEKIAHAGDNSSESSILVEFYNSARTYFETKC